MSLSQDIIGAAAKQSTDQLIKWFIASSHNTANFNEDHVKNAIALLYRVPSSRYAVLEWFTQIFEECVRRALTEYSSESLNPGPMHSLTLIEEILNNLLSKNSVAWAPMVCEWSVDALGQISSHYKSLSSGISPTSGNNALYSMVEFWLKLYPTRKLMEIYKKCLKLLIDQNADNCMDSLLATSTKHSPHFDWVVADIGDSFPSEIINRILQLGYRDFSQQQWGGEGIEDVECNLKSVVKILEHLAYKHKTGVKNAMLTMFKATSSDQYAKIKSVLYILQLVSDSQMLIKVSTMSFVSIMDDSLLNSLYKQYTKLSQRTRPFEHLTSLVVHVACQSSDGSFQLIQMLIDAGDKNDSNNKFNKLDKQAKKVCAKIMTSLVSDLKRMVIRKNPMTVQEFGIITQLKIFNKELCDAILSNPSDQKRKWLHTLLVIVCIQDHSHVTFSYLLMHMKNDDDFLSFVDLYKDVCAVIPELIKIVIEYSFMLLENNDTAQTQKISLFSNFHCLLTRINALPEMGLFITKLQKALCRHITVFLNNLNSINKEISKLSIKILLQLMLSGQTKLQTITFSLIQRLIEYFYRLLHEGAVNNSEEMANLRTILVNISQNLENFTIVAQFLLEYAGEMRNAKLFGQPVEDAFSFNEDQFVAEQNMSLFAQHRKSQRSANSGYFSNIAETGLIGTGPKKKKLCPLTNEQQNSNNNCLSLAIYRCACKSGSSGSMEGGIIYDMQSSYDMPKLISLSQKITENVLSHIPASLLHSDTLWPLPSFRQFTVERDLKILKFLDEHEYIWRMLELVANNPSALWNCSMILRSVLGALMHQWSSSRDSKTRSSSFHLKISIILIDLLGKGQIIPPPLSLVSEVFHMVAPYELFIILNSAWMFIHEHPVSQHMKITEGGKRDIGAERINIAPYLLPIQAIIHANITTLGHVYSRYKKQEKNGKFSETLKNKHGK